MMGSDDVKRMVKETFLMILCYSLCFTLIILLGIKLWTRIK